jgi:hypothetical protein
MERLQMAKGTTEPVSKSAKSGGRPVSVLVNEAQCKLQFFHAPQGISDGAGRIECEHRFGFVGRKAMARWLFLGEATLKGTSEGESYLSQSTIERLAERLGFDPSWPEWKTGTCIAFARKYNTNNTYAAKEFDCESYIYPPADGKLASLSVQSLNRVTLPVKLTVDLSMDEVPAADMTIWISAADLEVKIGETGRTVVVAQRKQFPHDYPPDGARDIPGREVVCVSADDNAPTWSVKSGDAPFKSATLRDFIDIIHIEDGGVVVVSLCAYLGDVTAVLHESREPGRAQRSGETHSIRWIQKGGHSIPQHTAKTAIAQRLALRDRQERLKVNDLSSPGHLRADGYLVLAKRQLKFTPAKNGD